MMKRLRAIGACLVVSALVVPSACATTASGDRPVAGGQAKPTPPAEKPAPVTTPPPQDKGAPVAQPTADAREMFELQKRIKDYVDLHRKLEAQLPPLSDRSDAAVVRPHQRALADKVRAARIGAKPGDIFTPDSRRALRRALARAIGPAERAAIANPEDNPPNFAPKVNVEYPPSLPQSSMPPSVLANLPVLPEELEFRFVGKYLILVDTHADIIVDFMSDAIR